MFSRLLYVGEVLGAEQFPQLHPVLHLDIPTMQPIGMRKIHQEFWFIGQHSANSNVTYHQTRKTMLIIKMHVGNLSVKKQ